MKVKLTEWYQDAKIVLRPEQVADVDSTLGAWLLDNRKAVAFVEYDPKDGGILIPEESRPDFAKQPTEEAPVMHTESAPKRSRSRK